MAECPFCKRIREADYIGVDFEVVRFEPLNPVTDGHMLFVPRRHVRSAAQDPWTTARVMACAAEWANTSARHANLITSIGSAATQTVYHLHVHYVPRHEGDGLPLPWTLQKQAADG